MPGLLANSTAAEQSVLSLGPPLSQWHLEVGFPACLPRPHLPDPQTVPSSTAGTYKLLGWAFWWIRGPARATHTAPAFYPHWRPVQGFGKTVYLFMDGPSWPGTALCRLNRMVIQSPNGNCSAHGTAVITSHADKGHGSRATGETCVWTMRSVTRLCLLFLSHALAL